ncbi:unnamed protein product [Symbiodinium pilosum]|uniref:Uncharacterized protein n=1 Tax=Symbiodinium pilosum TaxID=2952 RepID=A0A812UVQ0_SYMPI|nr:unnamed protein product [Symbiodinium pilosum]
MDSLVLFVALTPGQFQEFQEKGSCKPDQFSGRFGLRKTAEEAIERSHYFMNWTSWTSFENMYDKKDFVLLKITITARGFLTLMEQDILVRRKPNQYQLHGDLQEQVMEGESLLFQVDKEAFTVS